MSLNGLDDVKIKEAHEAAAAEPGGWFLLKYSARDEVDLLGKGNGGIVEVRNAIAAYEEPTPLFGFLRYRRRNVVIKYVPEECSRLVQARVAVHFNAVTDRFYPHDTTFSITSSKELKDSALSAACSLHTASGSTSSSTSSLRRRRLMEIAEDEEEDIRAKRQSTVLEERPTTAKPFDIPASEPTPSVIPEPSASPTGLSPTATNYRAIIADLETSPPPPREPLIVDDIRPTSPAKSIDERRASSQSTRPDLHSLSSYGSNGKPRIKLGPRPSLDVGGKPHTSATGSASQFRPVSSLPAGLKLTKTPSKTKQREKANTLYTPEASSMAISPPSIPENAIFTSQLRPHTSGGRPTTSSGVSIRPLASPSSMSTKFPLMTPEKARLMKALELRKKRENQAAAVDLASQQAVSPQTSLVGSEGRPGSATAPKEVQDTLQMLNDLAETAESGIAFDASSTLKMDESDATRSDSYPVSPVGASEKAESTRASSISDSTDGTVQEASIVKPDKVEEESPGKAPGSTEAESQPREETEQTPADVEPVENLYVLLPHTYTPTNRSPTSEATEEVKEEALAVNEDVLPKPEPTSQQDNSTSKNHITEVVEPSEPTLLESTMPKDIIEKESSKVVSPSEPVNEMKISPKLHQHDLGAEAVGSEIPTEAVPSIAVERSVEDSEHSPIESTFSKETESSFSRKQRRRGMVEPIRTDALTDQSAANSDAHFSSDDDLMDELQSAVVQEAMPISVSKSPISPVFPNPKMQKSSRFSRTFSNPLRKDKDDSKLLGASNSSQSDEKRSVSASAAYLNKINQYESRPIAKKVNVGSGISQRIKALEKLSSTGPAANPPNAPAASPNPSTSFFSVRKASTREKSTSPSVAERANSLSQQTPPPSACRETTPDFSKIRDRSPSIQSRVEAFTGSPTSMTKTQNPKLESVSVTARILGDLAQRLPPKFEGGKDHAQSKPLDLQQSPLVITHQIADASPPKETIQERRMSRESTRSNPKRERRSSITVIKDFISDMSEGRNSFSDRRRSMNLEISTKSPSIKSPSRPPSTHTSRPMSIGSRLSISSRDMTASSPPLSAESISSNSEEKPEKKASRTTRIMRRMSSSLTSSRKTISHAMSPTVREEFEPPNLKDSHPTPAPLSPTVNTIGEVNVQFPDSLLWKRRSMAIDSQGFLILTGTGIGNDTKAGPGASRRFHFSEFRMPAIPDVEMQELPNSVVLDFVEGGGLQVACEDRAGQGRVLTLLQEAHRSWSA